MKIALRLNEDNIIKGFIHFASEDYTALLANDNSFTLADVDSLEDIVEYKTKYKDGQLVQLEDYCQEYYNKQNLEEQKMGIQSQLSELDNWFNEYDMQIKQYERDTRLGIVGTYHIMEEEYTIEELDQEAILKSQQINTLRNQLNNL